MSYNQTQENFEMEASDILGTTDDKMKKFLAHLIHENEKLKADLLGAETAYEDLCQTATDNEIVDELREENEKLKADLLDRGIANEDLDLDLENIIKIFNRKHLQDSNIKSGTMKLVEDLEEENEKLKKENLMIKSGTMKLVADLEEEIKKLKENDAENKDTFQSLENDIRIVFSFVDEKIQQQVEMESGLENQIFISDEECEAWEKAWEKERLQH